MPADMFLVIDGIKGESKDKQYSGAIEVLAFNWGVGNSGSFHSGSGGGVGKAHVQDLQITKFVDSSSADLQLACLNGKHLKSAKLVIRKAGEKPLEYIVFDVSQVMVTQVAVGGAPAEDKLTENIMLNFANVHWQYKTQDEKGGGKDGGQYTWDIAGNAKG